MPRTGKSKAARKQEQAQREQIKAAQEAEARQLALLEPFREFGVQALPGLLSLSTPEGQAQYYQQYYQSPQFQAQASAARNQQLAASEATGGLQSSSTANQLARVSPTLGLQALQQQQNLLGQQANIGLSGAGAQAGYISQALQPQLQALGNIGDIQANKALAPFQTALQLGSLALGAYTGGIGGAALGGLAGGALGGAGGFTVTPSTDPSNPYFNPYG